MSVILETSKGDMVFDLHCEQCPIACKNFLKLCKLKYYNNQRFFSVQKNFIVQAGDPTHTGKGGESVYGMCYGAEANHFEHEIRVKEGLKHDKVGVLSMASGGPNLNASQFFVTTREDLSYLDEQHTVFGQLAEGEEVLMAINGAYVDDKFEPWQIIRIRHTVVLEDPFDDPPGLAEHIPRAGSPPPPLKSGDRIPEDEDMSKNEFEGMSEAEVEAMLRKRKAAGQALTLEMIADIPDADVKPPEDTLFVCKLNAITEDEDLEIIFSRFGVIRKCEVQRDRKTGDSLCYAFVEFEDAKSCEEAYFKMENVLIDERRIHVDFSQSVGKLWNQYSKGESSSISEKFAGSRGKKDNFEIKGRSANLVPLGGPGGRNQGMVFDMPPPDAGGGGGGGGYGGGGGGGGGSSAESGHKRHKHNSSHSGSSHRGSGSSHRSGGSSSSHRSSGSSSHRDRADRHRRSSSGSRR